MFFSFLRLSGALCVPAAIQLSVVSQKSFRSGVVARVRERVEIDRESKLYFLFIYFYPLKQKRAIIINIAEIEAEYKSTTRKKVTAKIGS